MVVRKELLVIKLGNRRTPHTDDSKNIANNNKQCNIACHELAYRRGQGVQRGIAVVQMNAQNHNKLHSHQPARYSDATIRTRGIQTLRLSYLPLQWHTPNKGQDGLYTSTELEALTTE